MALAMLLSVAAWGETAAFAETGESQSDLPAKESTPAGHSTDVIRERGVLTVAVSKDNSRARYVIPDNTKKYGDLAGTWDGSVPELCRRIAEELGVKVEFVEYATTQEQLDAAAAGEVDIAVDNTLCDNLTFEDGSPVLPMPENYYQLGGNQIKYNGDHWGFVEVQLTDAFFADEKALSNNYVIPVVMKSQTGADRILTGTPLIEGDQPVRTNSAYWSVKPMDFMSNM